ncbi:GntR family transcriptional regulator [Roseomonas terrae]|uniref:GntR family transcriptional regulator n=1 Tax=Neoroseomonas terrae TaxID=424799 RepID=A0ABS5EGF4_9PROT|nr:GntR family transcriptional regulator [Neoroseomonas terrae]
MLRDRILRGELGAGSRLDIDEIATAHGVSRTPVRDALKQLEGEGLVSVLPYRGVEVTRLTAADVEELFGIRIALERLCVARCVSNITEHEILGLRRILQRIDRLRRRDAAWMALNASFHDGIHAASRWPRLIEQIRELRTNVDRYVRAHARELGIERQREQHWALLQAIEARDAASAEAIIIAHLQATVDAMASHEPGT